MANIKAVKKDIRKSARRKENNTGKRARLRTYDKKVRSLLAAGKVDEARKVFRTYSTFLDRAGKTNLIHHRQADRRKSRMAQLIHKSAAPAKK